MKFTKSPKEPKKTPKEEYADQICSLTEKELRDLHKDLKIDHYGNTTAAVINTAAGVGLFSLRSTIRRDRTENMQIDVIEARMKEMGWSAHPNRYRDALPIALGVAAGTTSGMTFGLMNVEKSAKRTKDYVKKKDMFKTKEEVEIKVMEAETKEEVEIQGMEAETTEGVQIQGVEAETEVVAEEVQAAEISTELSTEHTSLDPSTQPVIIGHTIARKPVPLPLPTVPPPQTPSLAAPQEPTPTETHLPAPEATPITKESRFTQMNKKVRTFNLRKEKAVAIVSVAEIASEGEGQ